MAGEENSTGIVKWRHLLCSYRTLCGFRWWSLRDFSDINFYIVSRLAGERGLCDYVKSFIFTQRCAVRSFVEDYISK
jgi:hypothetical protein